MDKHKAYKILGLDKDSSPEQIKKRYKELALKYHPDKNQDPNATEKFKEMSEAYKIITNSSSDNDIVNDFPELNMLFSMFGMISPLFMNFVHESHIKRKGPPVQTSLKLTLEQIYSGGDFNVSYKVVRETGNMKQNVRTNIQNGVQITEVSVEPEINVEEELTKVYVYPCYDPESGPIIMSNVIDYGSSTRSKGDLYIFIVQEEHERFRRSGHDLEITLNITLKEALVGFETSILHLDGTDYKIKCNNIVGPGTEKVIKGLGLTENGSLTIKFNIEFPKELTDEQKEKLSEIL